MILNEYIKNPALLYLASAMELIIGIVLVLLHNIWMPDWRLLITIICWIVLLKSTVRVLFPMLASSSSINKFYVEGVPFLIRRILALLAGCFLLYKGFF
jgi:hypothetical protein